MIKAILFFLTATWALGQVTPDPSPTPAETPGPAPNWHVMVARLWARKGMNKPFTIWLTDGSTVKVLGTSYITIHPSAETTNVIVFTGEDTINLIPIGWIKDLTTP